MRTALDNLRQHVPITSRNQKLSKIETLRLARNYIGTLGTILVQNDEKIMQPKQMAFSLSRGLSQGTSNLIAGFLHLNPRSNSVNNNGLGQPSTSLSPSPVGDSFSKPGPCAFFEPNGLLRDYNVHLEMTTTTNHNSTHLGMTSSGANSQPYFPEGQSTINQNQDFGIHNGINSEVYHQHYHHQNFCTYPQQSCRPSVPYENTCFDI
ncbi:neurogenic differentiation factor 1 [Folsomia candida]|uniref:neurogenic differentiation factor 1 n=1 Tax=Folsomia candida TaxID=158441 RepID=UPI00160514B2|nr:neurogenic differentiation factor 1 [Folsomia candida]